MITHADEQMSNEIKAKGLMQNVKENCETSQQKKSQRDKTRCFGENRSSPLKRKEHQLQSTDQRSETSRSNRCRTEAVPLMAVHTNKASSETYYISFSFFAYNKNWKNRLHRLQDYSY